MSPLKKEGKEKLFFVILCAGKGTRLKNITKNIPKPLIKIEKLENISILHHLINNLVQMEIEQIGIVIGHLGNLIRQFISTLEKKNRTIKDRIKIIDSEEQYKLGPLYSLLSITKNKKFFTSKNHYVILPGDTIFDHELLKQVLIKISENFYSIRKQPIVFYRTIGVKPLIKLIGINRVISNAEIAKQGSDFILEKITQLNLIELHPDKVLNQIVPITVLSYDLINEIQKISKIKRYSTVRDILNYFIIKEKKILVHEINSNYLFHDIDYADDITNL